MTFPRRSGQFIGPGNYEHFELGTDVAATSFPTLTTGYQVRTNYHDSNRTTESGGTFRYTGTITAAKAGNWPNADGYFYGGLGEQFAAVGGNVKVWGAVGDGVTDDRTAIQAAFSSANRHIMVPPT